MFIVAGMTFMLTGPLAEVAWPSPRMATADLQLDVGVDSASFVADPAVERNLIVRMIGAGRTWTLLTRPTRVASGASAVFPVVLVLLLPFFAALTWWAWRSRGWSYRAHAAFALDLHAAVLATLAVSALAARTGVSGMSLSVGALGVAYTTWYAWVACRDALGGTTRELVARTAMVGALYTPPAIALTAILALRVAA